jgi:cathepsin B
MYGRALLFPLQAAQAELKALSNEVNSQNGSWSARVNERFHGMTFEQIKRQLGALKGGAKLPTRTHADSNVAIPESWQAAEAFPACKEVIETVVDQSACGSCWAMAVSSAASHRLCIKNNGAVTTQLSARDLLSCCSSCGFGCEGGYPSSAWSWLSSTGIVSGKNYNDFSKCVSYPFQPCGHHVDTFEPSCSTLDFSTPKCQKSCDDATSWPASYAEDKLKFSKAFGVYGEAAMQKELMANGPISVAFTVYSDFLNYKGGVYKKTSGSVLGGHAVTLIGWGVEADGTKYWTIQNSWNESWGEKGNFRIVRGTDECGIESEGNGADAPAL